MAEPDRQGAASGTAAACKTVAPTSLASANLRIDRAHWGTLVPVNRHVMSALPGRRERLQETAGAAIAARVATAPQPTLAVWFQGDSSPELRTLDPEAAPPDMPGRKADLLHHHLLNTAGAPLASATDGTIVYQADPDDIVALLGRGEATVRVLLPPMTPKHFALGQRGRGFAATEIDPPPAEARVRTRVVRASCGSGDGVKSSHALTGDYVP